MASTVCLASDELKLSAEAVCSKDSIKLLAPSVASGKLGVDEALREADTLGALDELFVVVSDFGEVNMEREEAEGGVEAELSEAS